MQLNSNNAIIFSGSFHYCIKFTLKNSSFLSISNCFRKTIISSECFGSFFLADFDRTFCKSPGAFEFIQNFLIHNTIFLVFCNFLNKELTLKTYSLAKPLYGFGVFGLYKFFKIKSVILVYNWYRVLPPDMPCVLSG